jgi:hypothetical protein
MKDVTPVGCSPHFCGDFGDGVGFGEIEGEAAGTVLRHEDTKGYLDGQSDETGP